MSSSDTACASVSSAALPRPLAQFVADFSALLQGQPSEETIISQGGPLLARLIASDAWLPPHCTEAAADRFANHLLYCHPDQRFCVVSMVWGPGQSTPIHDHTVWGLIGVVRGVEVSQRYGFDSQGVLRPEGGPQRLQPGEIEAVSPQIGDIHQVRNGDAATKTISIHVYGADIGTLVRHAYQLDGSVEPFTSTYWHSSLQTTRQSSLQETTQSSLQAED